MEVARKKTIFVEPEKREMLCKSLRISKATYYNAVNGVSNSDLAAMIRKAAMENYGGVPITRTYVRK
jgi:hypothetical protein